MRVRVKAEGKVPECCGCAGQMPAPGECNRACVCVLGGWCVRVFVVCVCVCVCVCAYVLALAAVLVCVCVRDRETFTSWGWEVYTLGVRNVHPGGETFLHWGETYTPW